MEERYFRLLLVMISCFVFVNFGFAVGQLFREDAGEVEATYRTVFRFVGYALVPLAALGLWLWHPWAFWVLGLATLCALAADFSAGLATAFWGALPHFTMIALTAEQYFARAYPEEEDEQAS